MDEPEELYCVCQKPYDGTFMIECESCQQWFHPACQDMTIEVDFLHLEKFHNDHKALEFFSFYLSMILST